MEKQLSLSPLHVLIFVDCSQREEFDLDCWSKGNWITAIFMHQILLLINTCVLQTILNNTSDYDLLGPPEDDDAHSLDPLKW